MRNGRKNRMFLVAVVLLVAVQVMVYSAAGGESTTSTTGPVEVSIWTGRIGVGATGKAEEKWTDTKIGAALVEKTGVNWNFYFTESGDLETAFNLRMASGDWEEVIRFGSTNFVWIGKLLDAGMIIPLDKYFNDPKYPNLMKVPKKVLDNFRYTDGHIYFFPASWFEKETQPWG